MDEMEAEEDEDDVAAGEALTGPLSDAFSGLQGGDDNDYQGEEEQRTFSHEDDDLRSKLFSKLKLFINREAPLQWMQLCLLSHGMIYFVNIYIYVLFFIHIYVSIYIYIYLYIYTCIYIYVHYA
jgi:hypothetical protein